MKRRHFITLLGGLTVAMPVAVGAQQRGELRRIGLLIPVSEANAAANVEAFRRGLRDLGDVEDVNVASNTGTPTGKIISFPGSPPSWYRRGST